MDELKQIKKRYGEGMMHLCRALFPTILEDEGILINILSSTFGHPKYLYDDIIFFHLVTLPLIASLDFENLIQKL